jgi:hypothetical protein
MIYWSFNFQRSWGIEAEEWRTSKQLLLKMGALEDGHQ